MIEGSVKGPEGTTAPETEKRVARDFRYSAKWKGSRRGAETQRRRVFPLILCRFIPASFLSRLCIWLRTFLILALLGPGSATLRGNLLPEIHLPLGTLASP